MCTTIKQPERFSCLSSRESARVGFERAYDSARVAVLETTFHPFVQSVYRKQIRRLKS